MSKKHRGQFVALAALLAARYPTLDIHEALAGDSVLVDGRVITNPAARVRLDASIRLVPRRRLRGEIKLEQVLSELEVPVKDRIAIDIGASAGGFTTALLAAGARRVYALDVGIGQLVGRLRVDPRIVNLEGHNLGAITAEDVPDAIEVVTMDLSYLPVSSAVTQLERLGFATVTHLVALVKPTFELRREELARTPQDLEAAVTIAIAALEGSAWHHLGSTPAARTGRRGASEVFVHARRDLLR